MIHYRRYLFACLSFVAVTYANMISARPAPEYQIEMIIYSHFSSSGLGSEQWPSISRFNGSADQPYPLLSKAEFRMNEEEAHIRRAPGYQVLLHAAWRQPTNGPQRALPMHIFGGNAYSNSASVKGKFPNGSAQYDPNLIWQVDGTVKMNVQHYIDTTLNLVLAAPQHNLRQIARDLTLANDAGDMVFFKLNDTRNMRSQELNSVSHPLYGVLVKVYPLNNG